jgi:hypothetical protein
MKTFMNQIIDYFAIYTEFLVLGIISSILATIVVLTTRYFYYKIVNTLPSYKIFNYIKNSKERCLVLYVRFQDREKRGVFSAPLPDFSSSLNSDKQYEERIKIPYVLSNEDSLGVSMVLNTLGKIGRTDNIHLSYVDKDYDKWENPMFLIGGNWKTDRVFENYNPHYISKDGKFIIQETDEEFSQKDPNDDLGLLEKVYNPKTNKPIWILMGMRGGGTAAAAYALSKWWKLLGKLYGKKSFGLVVQFNDKEGWEDASIISYYPHPTFLKKIFHPVSFIKFKKLKKEY